MESLVSDFNKLPRAVSDADIQRTVWVINLQYPTSYYGTGDKEKMELAMFRPGMMDQVVPFCKRSLLEKRDALPYLLSILLRAFTKSSGLLLHPDLCNYDSVLTFKGVPGEYIMGESGITIPKEYQRLLGNPPDVKVEMRRKADGKGAKMHPPTMLVVRDSVIAKTLILHLSLFGLGDLAITPTENLGTGFKSRKGAKFRRDVTFCASPTCTSLSPLHSRCAKCAITYYCSQDHQKDHWPRHKLLCKSTQDYFAQDTGKDEPVVLDMEGMNIVCTKGEPSRISAEK